MHITFLVCNPDLSGGIRIIADQAKMLKDRGHDVSIIGVITERITPRILARSLIKKRQWPKNPINTTHFDQVGLTVKLIKSDPQRGPEINDLPDSDLLIATWWLTAEWIKNMPDKKGRKVYYVQGYEPLYPSVTDAARVEETYRLPYAQMGVCQWLCDKVDEHRGNTNAPDCKLVENGIDTNFFTASERTKQRTPTIGTMYSTAGFKNYKLALDAIELLQKRIPNLKVISFGSTEPIPELPLPAGAEFHFRPKQKDIPKLYSACDAWILSSDHEGFGLPMLEALACRTPLIATEAGASPQLTTPKTGALCIVREAQTLADHAEKILMLPVKDWEAMSHNARQLALTYDWKHKSVQFEETLIEFSKNSA